MAALLMAGTTVQAQQIPPLPVDSGVRIGHLPNGLTYYIRHNDYPKGQADFYIAQKVGSILEEDNQRGLAHFLEHMCFNGTVNFPGNQVVSWLETVGVKFGQNLNAYTSIDETVYNIANVPTARVGVQDSCLLILHDWADGLLLDGKEIDKERAVIHEEWRTTNMGQQRILERLLPKLYPDSRYGYRLPIGTMEVVDHFPHKALRDYYETWYRPDQQGIIVVGDIDVNRIEAKIKEMFSDIKMPKDAKKREYYPVPDTKGTIYAIGSDPEQKMAIAQIMFKNEAFPDSLKNTMAYLATDYVTSMISSMLGARLDDISSKPDAPFAAAGVDYGDYFLASTKDALSLTGIAKDGDLTKVIEALYREVLRAKQGGFTATEYDRARNEYLSQLETRYKNRATRENDSFVQEYVQNFVSNEPIPGIEYEYQMMSMLAKQVPVAAINQAMAGLVSDDNRVILALLPQKDGFKEPTEAELSAAIAKVDAEKIEPYVDNVKSEPLIKNMPKAGKIVKETQNKQFGTIDWTLSNGAKVMVKKTDFKDDQILLDATAVGGTSIYGDDQADNLIFMPVVLSQYGLGDYTYTDLQKYMAGKQASIGFDFSNFSRDVTGQSTPKDLKTMMELLYMSFTGLNVTADEYVALQNMFIGLIHNQESDPKYNFSRFMNKSLYRSPVRGAIDVETIKKANREKVLSIAHTMMANASEYTFVFVGNVDVDSLRPLVEQYIASLPGKSSAKKVALKLKPELTITPGAETSVTTMKMESPQAYAAIVASAKMSYTPLNSLLSSMAGQILSARLITEVREKEGAVYSIHANGGMSRLSGGQNTSISTVFPLKPEKKDRALEIIRSQMEDMAKNITAEEFGKVKEFMVKDAIEGKEKNEDWLNAISGTLLNGVDRFNGNVELVKSVTPDQIEKFMKEFLAQKNYRVVLLMPEDTKDK